MAISSWPSEKRYNVYTVFGTAPARRVAFLCRDYR